MGLNNSVQSGSPTVFLFYTEIFANKTSTWEIEAVGVGWERSLEMYSFG